MDSIILVNKTIFVNKYRYPHIHLSVSNSPEKMPPTANRIIYLNKTYYNHKYRYSHSRLSASLPGNFRQTKKAHCPHYAGSEPFGNCKWNLRQPLKTAFEDLVKRFRPRKSYGKDSILCVWWLFHNEFMGRKIRPKLKRGVFRGSPH